MGATLTRPFLQVPQNFPGSSSVLFQLDKFDALSFPNFPVRRAEARNFWHNFSLLQWKQILLFYLSFCTSRAGEAGGQKFQKYIKKKNYSFLSLSFLDSVFSSSSFSVFLFFFAILSFFLSCVRLSSSLLSFFLSFFLSFCFFPFPCRLFPNYLSITLSIFFIFSIYLSVYLSV